MLKAVLQLHKVYNKKYQASMPKKNLSQWIILKIGKYLNTPEICSVRPILHYLKIPMRVVRA